MFWHASLDATSGSAGFDVLSPTYLSTRVATSIEITDLQQCYCNNKVWPYFKARVYSGHDTHKPYVVDEP